MKKETVLIDWKDPSTLSIDQKIAPIDEMGCDTIRFEETKSSGLIWFNGDLPDEIKDEVRSILERLMDGDPEAAERIRGSAITLKEVRKIIAWTNMILTDEDGATIGSLSSGTDISLQIKMEKAQYEQSKNFRFLFEDANDAILVIQDGKLRYVNRKVAEISGYTQSELMEMSLQDLIDLETKQNTSDREPDSREGGVLQEYKLFAKNGELISVHIYMLSTTWEGRVAAMVFIKSANTD